MPPVPSPGSHGQPTEHDSPASSRARRTPDRAARVRFRRAITLMRRDYPQFISVSGERLPTEVMQVIFPLTYWPSIQREAKARGLDPYLVAALIDSQRGNVHVP